MLPIAAQSADLYQIHQLSEQEILQTYVQLLRDACHFADRDWTNSLFDPAAGYWGDGVSSGNEGIRSIGSMVLACGTLLKYDENLGEGERKDLLNKTTAALRYATATHFAGKQKCTNGKQWGGLDRPGGNAWQSSYWTGSLAMGAWLIWGQLDPALQQDVQRVVAAQDDLMSEGNPPTGLWSDTKAEENGWCVPCLVLGELMFPSNAHAAAWHNTARKYMMNTLCTEADLHDTNLVDGRPVNQWVLGANLQPDFTLENHGIFHPSYVGCSSYFLTQAALYYSYARRPTPEAANHHLMDTWRMFRTIILPWGESACPQGMDWELHGLPFITLYGALATRDKDPFAARMEQMSLQYLRSWQLTYKGSLTLPGSPFGITRHAINAELAAYGFIAHKVFGPSVSSLSAREAAAQEQGVWDYPYVDFIAHRTEKKFASFSWKNRIMGLLMPIENHESNPDFIVPIRDGFIGSFQLAGAGNKMSVVEHSRRQTPDGFETSGTMLIDSDRLKQTLRMISIGSQTVVYEDHVTALSNVTVRAELGVPVGIENDGITGGTRTVSTRDGEMKFDWQHPQPPKILAGNWANVDGRLGLVMVQGAAMRYAQASSYSRGISVYEDILCGSCSNDSRPFKAGEEVAHRVAILCVEVTPAQTSSLAKSCHIETTPTGRVLRFQQPDGKLTEVPLF